jgi:branched-chain amino acid transport system substrate-binding protein
MTDTHDLESGSAGIDRRNLMRAVGGGAATAALAGLAGCSTLISDGDEGDGNGGTGGGATQVGTDPLDIGMLTFTQGAPGVLGIQIQRGAELAVERINGAGGIAGQRQVNLEIADEGQNPLDSYRQFIDEGKDATFGPVSSGTHETIAPEVESAEVVNVSSAGTVTTLYEETVPDPKYSFRFQNSDLMEAVVMAREAVNRIGAENINTVAGVNPGYSFGEDSQRVFKLALEGLLGDFDIVYEGFPDLGTSDMSTHITEVNSAAPDLMFSSLWGGDAVTFLDQAVASNLFENTRVVSTVMYSAADDLSRDTVESAEVIAGARTYYWDKPDRRLWKPGRDLFNDARQQDNIGVPNPHYMAGYGCITAWATAVEKAIDILGGYPSQKQIAEALEGHGFFTPAGYHVMGAKSEGGATALQGSGAPGHSGRSTAYAGEMVWNEEFSAAALEDVNSYSPVEISPPPGQTGTEWLQSWRN